MKRKPSQVYLRTIYYSTIGQLSYLVEISVLELLMKQKPSQVYLRTIYYSIIGQLSYLVEISVLELLMKQHLQTQLLTIYSCGYSNNKN